MTNLDMDVEKALNAYIANDNVDNVTKKERLEEIRDYIEECITELEDSIEENEGEEGSEDQKADPPEGEEAATKD